VSRIKLEKGTWGYGQTNIDCHHRRLGGGRHFVLLLCLASFSQSPPGELNATPRCRGASHHQNARLRVASWKLELAAVAEKLKAENPEIGRLLSAI
jgi:hypothetical protein